MSSERTLIPRVLRFSAVLGGLCAIGLGAVFGPAYAWSSALGTVVGAVNLWAMMKLAAMVFDSNSGGSRKIPAAVLLGTKTIVLLCVVGFLFSRGWIRGGAFITGLMMVSVSIVLGQLMEGDDSSSPRSPL